MPEENKRPAKRNRPDTDEALMPQVLYSAEAEKAVLGCMMAQPGEVIHDAQRVLTKNDFFVPAHQEIFDALISMNDKRVAIDVMTIHQWLTDRKMDQTVGSPGILSELLVGFATHLNVGSYIKIVKDKGLLRALQKACATIVQDIADMPDSVSSVLDRAEVEIYKVTQIGLDTSMPIPMRQLADDHYERIIARKSTRGLVGLPTGFSKLDEWTAGWKPGEMIVLAARPGVGKSALGMKFASHAGSGHWEDEGFQYTWMAPGVPVGVISLEMTHGQLMDRIYSCESDVSMSYIRKGIALDRDKELIRQACYRVREWPMFIDAPSSLTITALRSKARRMKEQLKIELLVVDYLQLLTAPGASRFENRQNEVATISRGIKSLALELDIPIIILAQLNRKTDENKSSAPALHHLRESGAIEQDADVVLLLHRPESQNDNLENAAASMVIPYTLNVAKQRNGPTDTMDILLHSAYTRFDEPIRHQTSSEVEAEDAPLFRS